MIACRLTWAELVAAHRTLAQVDRDRAEAGRLREAARHRKLSIRELDLLEVLTARDRANNPGGE